MHLHINDLPPSPFSSLFRPKYMHLFSHTCMYIDHYIWYRGLGSIFEIDGQAVVTVNAGRQESFEYNEEYKLLYQNIVLSLKLTSLRKFPFVIYLLIKRIVLCIELVGKVFEQVRGRNTNITACMIMMKGI
jgi:hypothetical protein